MNASNVRFGQTKIIDIHTHGINGYDTRTAEPEDILRIAEFHGSCGVTDIVPTIYSATIEKMRENMKAVRQATQMQALENANPMNKKISKIVGIHLEGPFLNPARCGALDSNSFLQPSNYDFHKLVEGFEDMVSIITIAPELNRATNLIKAMSDEGIVVSMGHSDATYSEAEAAFQAGAKGITHIFNAMRGFHHREPGLVGFGLFNQHVYIELIADPFHLNSRAVELIFKIKNPERIIIISDSVKDTTVIPAARSVTDFNGILQGGSSSIVESAKRLVEMGFEEELITECISSNPTSYLLE